MSNRFSVSLWTLLGSREWQGATSRHALQRCPSSQHLLGMKVAELFDFGHRRGCRSGCWEGSSAVMLLLCMITPVLRGTAPVPESAYPCRTGISTNARIFAIALAKCHLYLSQVSASFHGGKVLHAGVVTRTGAGLAVAHKPEPEGERAQNWSISLSPQAAAAAAGVAAASTVASGGSAAAAAAAGMTAAGGTAASTPWSPPRLLVC